MMGHQPDERGTWASAGRQERPDEGARPAVGATSATWSELGADEAPGSLWMQGRASEFLLRTTGKPSCGFR